MHIGGLALTADGLGGRARGDEFASVHGSAEDADPWPPSPAPWSSGSRSSTPRISTGPDTAKRSSAGRSQDVAPMSCSPPNSGAAAAAAWGGATRCALRSRRALPASDRLRRPLLSPPGRPVDTDRGDRRSHGRPGVGRAVRYLGLSEAAPRPSAGRRPRMRSPHSRPSIRCSAASRRSRSFRPHASSASDSSRTARSAAACSPDISSVSRISREMTGGGCAPRWHTPSNTHQQPTTHNPANNHPTQHHNPNHHNHHHRPPSLERQPPTLDDRPGHMPAVSVPSDVLLGHDLTHTAQPMPDSPSTK